MRCFRLKILLPGIVADNYDLLVNFENYIVGEQIVKV